MLKFVERDMILNAAIFGAFLIIVVVLGFFLWQTLFASEEHSQGHEQPAITQSQQNPDSKDALGSSPAPRAHNPTEEAIANYTKWLAIFTLFLVLATIGLFVSGERNVEVANKSAKAARESADISRQALYATQRAIVGVAGFPMAVYYGDNGVVRAYGVNFKWENSGNTTALNANAGVTYVMMRGEFETVVFNEPPIKQIENNSIPPKQNLTSIRSVQVAELMQVWRKEARLFILGRVEYQDVFGSQHHTQVCIEIAVYSDPSAPVTPEEMRDMTKRPQNLHHAIWREHNSSSESGLPKHSTSNK